MSTLTTDNINKYVDYQITKSNQIDEIERLERLKRVLLKRQFVDAPVGLSESEYNKWLKEAKKTYLLSIPTQSLLMGDIHHYPNHTIQELFEDVIGDLSSRQIIKILNSLDLYTIMKLLTDNIYYREITSHYLARTYGNIELIGEMPEGIITAYPCHSFNRSLSLRPDYRDRDGVKSINNKNAYEVLYSKLRLPISTVLSSINEVNTHLPCNIPFDEDLCTKIERIQKDESSPQLLKKFSK